jgi:chemotaxis family two-component system response regulator Rcp1
LVIEDNPADVRLMKEAVRECNLNVRLESVLDGEQALRFLSRQGEYSEAERPSLIFLDLNLPRATSKDILKFIKQDAELRTIPVAVLTSSDAEKDIREAYELHANCYLRKPVDLDSFLNTIRAAISFWVGVACIPSSGR